MHAGIFQKVGLQDSCIALESKTDYERLDSSTSVLLNPMAQSVTFFLFELTVDEYRNFGMSEIIAK